MLQIFLCWLFGHKTMVKAYTGNVMESNGIEDKLFIWRREKYCTRCGVEVWKNV